MTHVLIVDDEPSVRLLLRDILEMEGYDVREAPDGPSALAMLAEQRPDCVLLDVMMPGMSGIEVLGRLRDDAAMAGLPVMMLTAATDDETTWSGWATGADYYLAKPFDVDLLLQWTASLASGPAPQGTDQYVDLDVEVPDNVPVDVVFDALADLAAESTTPSSGPDGEGDLAPPDQWRVDSQAADLFRTALGDAPQPAGAAAQSRAVPAPAPAPAPGPAPVVSVAPALDAVAGVWRGDSDAPSTDELERALRTDQIWVAYQPIVALEDGRAVGVEAFARWRHPQRGDLAPAQFIPLAESSGLDEQLGRFVLASATAQVAEWNAARASAGLVALMLTVNVSRHQIDGSEFLPDLLDLLEKADFPPPLLVLDLGAPTLAGVSPETLSALERVLAAGVRLALDDVSGGESSATYLRRFAVAFMKVDRSFVRGIGDNLSDDAVVTGIVAMARRFGRAAVAEGVETKQQAVWLRRLGCQYAQGFYFGHPAPAGHLHEMLLDDSVAISPAISAISDKGPTGRAFNSQPCDDELNSARLDRLDRALPLAAPRSPTSGAAWPPVEWSRMTATTDTS